MTLGPAGAPSYDDLAARLAAAEAALEAVAAGVVDALASGDGAGAEIVPLERPDSFFMTLVTEMQEATASLNSNGTLLYANPRFAEMLGLPLSQVLGRTLAELTAKDGRDAARLLLTEAASGPARGTLDLLHGDGRLVPVSVSAAPIAGERPEFCLVATDLTERKQAESTLRAAEERFRSAFEQAPIGMALLSLDGRFERVNAVLAEIAGKPEAQLLGTPLASLLDRPGARALPPRLAGLRTGGQDSSAIEVRYLNADGRGVWVAESAAVIRDADGRAQQILLQVEDIEERRRYQRQLEEARRGAQEANEQKTRFLSNMSHEMRTPLNGVLGMATLLAERIEDGEYRRQLDIIRSSGEQLLRLIDELLDLSRIESGVLRVDHEPFDLGMLADEVITMLEPKARAKGLELSLDVTGPTDLISDAGRVRQVLLNLIANAIKFTAAGSVRVVVSADPARPEPGHAVTVTCRVVDTGPGISATQQKEVFAPFMQVDDSLSRAHDGAGLGLAIARSLARNLGGDIAVSSEVGAGAQFTFTFRARAIGREQVAASREPWAWDETMAQRHPLRILIAEDSNTNRLVATAMLLRLGYVADTVVNGREAVEAVAKTPYDLVLMDVHMPEMDGVVATQEIRRALPTGRRPRIVGLSASAGEADRDSGLRAGMEDYLTKPMSPKPLVEALLKTPTPSPNVERAP